LRSKADNRGIDGLIVFITELLPLSRQEKYFYPAKPGEVLADRYQILVKVGWGVSSTVWLARDSHDQQNSHCYWQFLVLQRSLTLRSACIFVRDRALTQRSLERYSPIVTKYW
jgi:hypothetical protein